MLRPYRASIAAIDRDPQLRLIGLLLDGRVRRARHGL